MLCGRTTSSLWNIMVCADGSHGKLAADSESGSGGSETLKMLVEYQRNRVIGAEDEAPQSTVVAVC